MSHAEKCRCGPAVQRKVLKDGPTKGRHFLTCGRSKGPGQQGCGYFKWLDETILSTKEPIKDFPSTNDVHNRMDRDYRSIHELNYDIYTDGACKGNSNVKVRILPAGWGVVVVCGGLICKELYGPVVIEPRQEGFMGAEVTSNNTAELCAIGEALKWVRDSVLNNDDDDRGITRVNVVIRYDSEYAANSVTGIFNGKKNRGLIENVRSILSDINNSKSGKYVSVSFKHVKGHSNDKWNDMADALANKGSDGFRHSDESEGGIKHRTHEFVRDDMESSKRSCISRFP